MSLRMSIYTYTHTQTSEFLNWASQYFQEPSASEMYITCLSYLYLSSAWKVMKYQFQFNFQYVIFGSNFHDCDSWFNPLRYDIFEADSLTFSFLFLDLSFPFVSCSFLWIPYKMVQWHISHFQTKPRNQYFSKNRRNQVWNTPLANFQLKLN